MLRSIRDEEFETEEAPRDVEVTLGPAVLFAIVCGLLLLCGLCFGVGYTSGRRSVAHLAVSAKEAASGQTLAQAASSAQKPAAKGVTPATSQPTPAAVSQSDAAPASSAGNRQAAPTTDSAVRPALAGEAAGTEPSPPPNNTVQPALAPGSGIMVQVAAVSHSEDANVLMGALRKRGYAVTARRANEDSLIHVQIGPFASHADANAMSQRLLNDGYNAVVLP
jgi:DedD protein